MSNRLVNVDENKTFGEGDDGLLQCASEAVTFTIPNDSIYDFEISDSLEIFNNSSGNVTIAEDSAVTLLSKGTTIPIKGHVTIEKVDTYKWMAWGDLT